MIASVKKSLIFLLLVLVIIFVLQKINWLPSFRNVFKSQPVVIDKTPVIIKEIKSLAKLLTVTYTDEVAMDTAKPSFGMPSFVPFSGSSILTPAMDQLVIIGKGKVIAGTDLTRIGKDAVVTSDDSIHVILPAATILETIVNPSGFETFIEHGTWSEAAVIALKIKVREAITKRAFDQGILQQANNRSLSIIKIFLSNTGFKKIGITIADQSP